MNRVELIGRLTKDVELRRSTNGNSVVRFTTAVDRRFKQPGGPEADFISCVAFGKTAENMARFLHKGSLIAVEGRIQTGSYMNQQQQRVYTTDIVADSVTFLETRKSQGYGDNNGFNQNYSNQNSGYQNQQYGADQNAYQGGYNANPYAQSVNTGFGNPAPTPVSSPASSFDDSSSATDATSGLFDDTDTLDISSDDLPF
ncbi:MAG: single-stranded DNA-binding protein [Allobaculum sp.]